MRLRFWNREKRQALNIINIDGVKISNSKPPIYDNVCQAFGIRPKNVYYTYADTIYNPDNLPVPPDIIAHEKEHIEQQGGDIEGAELWWGKYLRDPIFRVDQESRAYARQYQFICQTIKGRNERFNILMQLAKFLSGPLYNKAISQTEAFNLIKELSGVK